MTDVEMNDANAAQT